MQRSGAAFDEKCQAQRLALSDCATRSVRKALSLVQRLSCTWALGFACAQLHALRLQAKKPKVRSTINFHLKRLSAAMKR